jgi:DNA-binding GntR family transcriptional regulator
VASLFEEKPALALLPVKRAPDLIRAQVAAHLRGMIADGRLKPGQQLVEREICEATTASRASVREALRELEANGLVVSERGRGVTVAMLTDEEAARWEEIRMSLEELLGWRFALSASDEDLAELETIVAEMAELVARPGQLLLVKNRFYEILYRGAGSPELAGLVDQLHLRGSMAQSAAFSKPGRAAEAVAEFRAVLASARTRDPADAARRSVEHVVGSATNAIGAEAVRAMKTPLLADPDRPGRATGGRPAG